ncbi:hypothetical protein ACU686_40255 [Yinghuangia aomiensis]
MYRSPASAAGSAKVTTRGVARGLARACRGHRRRPAPHNSGRPAGHIDNAASGLRGWETAAALRYVGETWGHQVDSLHAALMSGQARLTQSAVNYEVDEKKISDGFSGMGG